MRQSRHAHTGRNFQSHINRIVADALRAAALAPTYQDALDITGAALSAVALLARTEVRDGQ